MGKRIFGQIGTLKEEKTDEYKALHKEPWPEVLDMIRRCHMKNYYIFLQGQTVFSTFIYEGDDYEKDMEMMAKDPVTQKWWTHTKPCFERFSVSPESEFYHDMEMIFQMDE